MRGEGVRRTAIRAGLVGLLLAATLAYTSLEKHITVRIEGSIRPVASFALTVGDALQRAGISVGAQDRVDPSLDTPLNDNLKVMIYRAKPVTIMLNGKPRQVVVTAMTVDELLREIALRSSLRDYVGASRSARVFSGMTIEYRQAVAITVVHDDRRDKVITNAASVWQVLKEMGVTLGVKDKVQPAVATYPTTNLVVKILRVGERREIRQSVIPSPTTSKRVMNVEYGRTSVIQQGRPGLKVYRYLSTYVDGRRVKQKLLGSQVVRKPVPKVIGIGAGFPGCVCRRGSQSGKASWYGAAGLTAAHPSLPFGTVVRVTNLSNGKSVNVVIRDRGPFVRGRIIDMSKNAFSRIASVGAGVVRVKILW